jgi:hypothetical protein
MSRFATMSGRSAVSAALAAPKARLLLQLALLAVGLLAVSLGGGAPECAPDAGGC